MMMLKMKMIHQVKKRKVNLVVNKDKNRKLIFKKLKMKMVLIRNIFLFSKKLIFQISEQNDEIDTKKKTTTTNRKAKGPGSSKKQAASIENEEIPINDELKLSEDDEATDEKTKGATAKKGPAKRSAPASGKKPAVTSTKKKSQNDEPFEDRTNDEVEHHTEDG